MKFLHFWCQPCHISRFGDTSYLFINLLIYILYYCFICIATKVYCSMLLWGPFFLCNFLFLISFVPSAVISFLYVFLAFLSIYLYLGVFFYSYTDEWQHLFEAWHGDFCNKYILWDYFSILFMLFSRDTGP